MVVGRAPGDDGGRRTVAARRSGDQRSVRAGAALEILRQRQAAHGPGDGEAEFADPAAAENLEAARSVCRQRGVARDAPTDRGLRERTPRSWPARALRRDPRCQSLYDFE